MDTNTLVQILISLVAKYPITAVIVSVLGTCRLVFKPLMTFLHALVAATPSSKDDELLAKTEASPVYKGIAFVLDYVVSIKLPGAPASSVPTAVNPKV